MKHKVNRQKRDQEKSQETLRKGQAPAKKCAPKRQNPNEPSGSNGISSGKRHKSNDTPTFTETQDALLTSLFKDLSNNIMSAISVQKMIIHMTLMYKKLI